MDKNKINWRKTRFYFSKLLTENYYVRSQEWQYKNVQPAILVEKLLFEGDEDVRKIFRFHCIHGKLVFVSVDIDEGTINHRKNLYDTKWDVMPCQWKKRKRGAEIEKPTRLAEVTVLAEKLAQDFDYVRADFYLIEDKIYFSELTLYPGSAIGLFEPIECDFQLGKLLQLPTENRH